MKTYKIKTGAGDEIRRVAQKAKDIAIQQKVIVEFDFNEIKCLVSKNTVVDWLVRDYMNAHIMQWNTIGDKCEMIYDNDTEVELRTRQLAQAKRWKEEAEARRKKDDESKAAIAKQTSSIEPEWTDIPKYEDWKSKNSDGYGRACFDYAEAWAKLMQMEIAKGKTVKECADETQKGLGYLGITGFQYGCVISILSQCWKHGEDLRKWHNKKYGIDENKKGIVNPAILTLTK